MAEQDLVWWQCGKWNLRKSCCGDGVKDSDLTLHAEILWQLIWKKQQQARDIFQTKQMNDSKYTIGEQKFMHINLTEEVIHISSAKINEQINNKLS